MQDELAGSRPDPLQTASPGFGPLDDAPHAAPGEFTFSADAATRASEPARREPVVSPPVTDDDTDEPHFHISDPDASRLVNPDASRLVNPDASRLADDDTGATRRDSALANAPASIDPAAPPQPRAEPAPRAVAPEVAAPGDALLDYRLQIDGNGVHGNVFNDIVTRCRSFHRPVRWWGLPVGARAWQELQPWRDVRYEHLLVAVQLADRNGSTSPDDLTAVLGLVEPLARRNGLSVKTEDIAAAAQRGQALDALGVDVDLLIGLNVVARTDGAPITLEPLLRAAVAAGMTPAADGSYQMLDLHGELLFQLVNHDAEPFDKADTSASVTLQFDVPRVADGVNVFDDMIGLGVRLAEACAGKLVDDNLRPLTEAGVEKITTQLTRIYERMDARGVPAGSARALRLFA
jgi:hypothetical protein